MTEQFRRRVPLDDMPDVTPIFPLSGALLLPRSRMPLNIFEPRYLAMIDDTLRSDHRMIGVAQPRHGPGAEAGGDDDDASEGPLYVIGCVGRLTSFSEANDGRYLVSLLGVQRFRIVEEVEGFQPFRRARVDWSEFEDDQKPARAEINDAQRADFFDCLRAYFEATKLGADWDALTSADTETLINAIAMLCPFEAQEKQALLEAPTLSDRLQNLQTLMQFAIASSNINSDNVQ